MDNFLPYMVGLFNLREFLVVPHPAHGLASLLHWPIF